MTEVGEEMRDPIKEPSFRYSFLYFCGFLFVNGLITKAFILCHLAHIINVATCGGNYPNNLPSFLLFILTK